MRFVFVFLFVTHASSLFAKAPTLTATDVANQIAADGSKIVLARVYANETTWSQLLRGVATGQRAWLKVANRLRSVSDAGASEQLELAVGEALEHRPANVLRIALPVFGLAVCGGPDVDDARYDSYDLSLRAINKRIAVIGEAQGSDIQNARDACISELGAAKAGIAKFYGKQKE